MPPLATRENSSVTDASKVQEKKKLVLPLFGKRGTFTFSAVASLPKITAPVPEICTEEDENDEESVEILPSISESTVNLESPQQTEEADNPPISTGAIAPNSNCLPNSAVELPVSPTLDAQEVDHDDPPTLNHSSAEPPKKKRSRQRQRGDRCRENVDYDEVPEMVSSEKYSTWVPPQNQSGDGSTTLNDKYGY